MKRGLQWPIAVGGILLLTMSANIAMAIVAGRDPSFAVEPDYYQKAVRFDDEMAQRAASARLGWTISVELSPASPTAACELVVALRDATGDVVAADSVTAVAFHNARAAHPLEVTLAPAAAGVYRAALDARRPGEWEVRVTAVRGSDRFVSRARVSLALPSAP